VTFDLVQTHLGEVGDEIPAVFGDVGDGVVLEVKSGEEGVEAFPCGGGMEGDEGVGDILAGEIEKGKLAARMVVSPIGDVVDLALNGNP